MDSWQFLLIFSVFLLILLIFIFLATQQQRREMHEQRSRFDEHQVNSLKTIQDSLQKGLLVIRDQISNTLQNNSETLSQKMQDLTDQTDKKLKEISEHVDKRLSDGFEKTTATFTDIVKRLAIIDQAQKRITELSNNVMSLQDILNDKRSRGAFGEVQLESLIRNMIPENNFSLQHTLSNGKRIDCLLFLPKPTGNIPIDSKFPLESFQKLTDQNITPSERRYCEQQFKQDIKQHIQDISTKYIIPEETSDGAIMFTPAEAIFAEIHSHHPEIVQLAYQKRVWIVSPTTLMAVLTTARAALKDQDTKKQVHIIQEHLITLSRDFERFQKRMDNLARHIGQAHQDVEQVHKSSQKITARFEKIERVELGDGIEEESTS